MTTPKETNNIRSIESILTNEEEENEKLHAYGIQLSGSCAIAMVLKAAIEMGLLQMIHDHVGPNGISAVELAAQIKAQNPTAPPMLDRILGLLVTYSVVAYVEEDGGTERRYRAMPVTKLFVPDENGASYAPNLNLLVDKVFLRSWSKLKEAVLEGGVAFNMVHGTNLFEYCGKDPRFSQVFHNAMGYTTMIINSILAKYNGFENVRTLVDVAGSLGHNLRAIISQYPFIHGINFDLPHVVKSAPPYPGIEHVGGDMFESVPRGDAIFLKWILHNWNDEQCLKLLRNCYKALPDNGKVIVVELIVPDEPEMTEIGKFMTIIDLVMMAQVVGGKERSLSELQALAKGAGFAGINLQFSTIGGWVFEIYK